MTVLKLVIGSTRKIRDVVFLLLNYPLSPCLFWELSPCQSPPYFLSYLFCVRNAAWLSCLSYAWRVVPSSFNTCGCKLKGTVFFFGVN
jgi:hypothetical protein